MCIFSCIQYFLALFLPLYRSKLKSTSSILFLPAELPLTFSSNFSLSFAFETYFSWLCFSGLMEKKFFSTWERFHHFLLVFLVSDEMCIDIVSHHIVSSLWISLRGYLWFLIVYLWFFLCVFLLSLPSLLFPLTLFLYLFFFLSFLGISNVPEFVIYCNLLVLEKS